MVSFVNWTWPNNPNIPGFTVVVGSVVVVVVVGVVGAAKNNL